MKTLQESLFDKDLIEKPLDKLDNIFKFDGQIIYKTNVMWTGHVEMRKKFLNHLLDNFGNKFDKNFLSAVDWNFLKKESKKTDANKIDLDKYSYYSNDMLDRTKQTLDKSELFAKYVLSLDLGTLWESKSYNSRFRDTLCECINRFIDEPDKFEFDVHLRPHDFTIRLMYNGFDRSGPMIVAQWMFEEKNYV